MDRYATVASEDGADGFGERRGLKAITGFIAGARTRRSFVGLLAASAALPWISRGVADSLTGEPQVIEGYPARNFPLFDEATAAVIPSVGHQTRIVLKDAILKLIQHGVIDRTKYMALARDSGSVPKELSRVLDEPTDEPIYLTSRNAGYYVNLLWPIGLSDSRFSNFESPLNGASLSTYASTGG